MLFVVDKWPVSKKLAAIRQMDVPLYPDEKVHYGHCLQGVIRFGLNVEYLSLALVCVYFICAVVFVCVRSCVYVYICVCDLFVCVCMCVIVCFMCI